MKKPIAIILLLLYIAASSGVVIKAHYCCGRLKAIHLVLGSSTDQKCCGKTMAAKDCCKDKVSTYQISDDHKASLVSKTDDSFKAVLDCVGVLSQGFFQAYDDRDSMELCTAATAEPRDIYLTIRVLRV